jgi:hypothetical protein
MKTKIIKSLSIFASVLMVGLGTYNAVFMNSTSFMNEKTIVHIKRLDEINGRIIAAQRTVDWKELAKPALKPVVKKEIKPIKAASSIAPVKQAQKPSVDPEVQVVEAVIKNDLDLNLSEFYNSQKFQKLAAGESITGNLIASAGVIESLEVTLPDTESLHISFSEMKGNTFVYEHMGDQFNGMIYEVGQGAYMVTLNDGPLAGTRMKFIGSVDGNQAPAQQMTPSAVPGQSQIEISGDVNRGTNNAQEFGFNFNG